jgi:hypothetical protein
MSTYYRTTDGRLVELTVGQFSALAPSKRATLKLYTVDPQPTPSASQRVEQGPVVVDGAAARLTWVLVTKTAEQIAFEAFAAERAIDLQQLRQVYLGLKNGTGTNLERITRCERVLVRILKDLFGGEPA